MAFTWEGRRLHGASREPVTSSSDKWIRFSSEFFVILLCDDRDPFNSHVSWAFGSSLVILRHPRHFHFALPSLYKHFLVNAAPFYKQHVLTMSLIGSLKSLSNTYASITRFKDQLTQNEKLASLGEYVAQVANQIKKAMAIIRERSLLLTAQADSESRIQRWRGKSVNTRTHQFPR